jgi:POT family proton-dependent oligopeptide transporter
MTQKICQALSLEVQDLAQVQPISIDQLVAQLFLRRGRVLEANLSYAEKFFLAENRAARILPMLRLYGRLLADEPVAAQGDNPVQVALRLTGMAAERHDMFGVWLTVRNRIFATVFDLTWVRKQESDRLIAEPLYRWLESNKSEDHLLRGQALAEARSWSRIQSAVTAEEGAFLLASLDLAHREAEAQRQLEEARQFADKERTQRQLQDDAAREQQVNILTTAIAWRSFAFYVVFSQLVPYLTESLSFSNEAAKSLANCYFMAMFLVPILGGILSDWMLGCRRSMLTGTTLLTIGYFMMTVPNRTVVYIALGLQIIGHGLDRSSMATLVGNIYPIDDIRRRRAFFVYHLVANVGTLMPALLRYFLSQRYGANIGLAAAGPGAMISLIFCLLSDGKMLNSDTEQKLGEVRSACHWSVRFVQSGTVRLLSGLCILASLFWIGAEQNGASLIYWVNHNVDRTMGGWLRVPIDASTMLLLNPIFVSMIIPAALWICGFMRNRNLELSNEFLLIVGVVFNALAFVLLAYAGSGNIDGGRVNAGWFMGYMFFSAMSEVCVVPVGMSIVSNLAPQKNAATLMGAWLVAVTLGSMLASQLGSLWQSKPQNHFFSLLAGMSLIGALLLILQVRNFKSTTVAKAANPLRHAN